MKALDLSSLPYGVAAFKISIDNDNVFPRIPSNLPFDPSTKILLLPENYRPEISFRGKLGLLAAINSRSRLDATRMWENSGRNAMELRLDVVPTAIEGWRNLRIVKGVKGGEGRLEVGRGSFSF